MKITIETFDANGALKTAIATVPAHGHTGSSDGGQLNAGSVFSAGQVPLARGGTNADLSATGGTGQYLKQSSAAAAITVGTIADADLPATLAGKTLTTPTIASFTNATHDHSNAAGGGNLGANAFSDQSANLLLAGPTSGAAAEPTFRAINYQDIVAGSMLPVLGYIVLQDQKAQNTDGGTFTTGAWQTRTLNTEVADTGNFCSLSSNQFTLTAGTYRGYALAPAYAVLRHQARLQNVTDATTLATGQVMYTAAGGAMSASLVEFRFTVAASKALEIQHQCQSTASTNGFGLAGNFTTEVFTTVMLIRES